MLIDTESEDGSWLRELAQMPWWTKLHVIQCNCDENDTNCGCHVKTDTIEIEAITLETDEPTQGS
jgi:site-specific recombinase